MKGIPNKAELEAIIERLRNGSSTLINESKACGFSHNGPLRGALRELLGKEGYDGLMEGKRPIARPGAASTKEGVVAYVLDDSAVPVITSTKHSDGWRTRYQGLSPDAIFVSPEGVAYQRAASNARADLIVDMTEKGMGRVRLRQTKLQMVQDDAPVKSDAELEVEEKARMKRETKSAKEWAKANPEEAARIAKIEQATIPATPKPRGGKKAVSAKAPKGKKAPQSKGKKSTPAKGTQARKKAS